MGEEIKVLEISSDHTNFLQDIADHLNQNKWKSVTYTPELIQQHEMFMKLFADIRPGDKLQFWSWFAGPFAAAEGYKIVRDGEEVAHVTTCVS